MIASGPSRFDYGYWKRRAVPILSVMLASSASALLPLVALSPALPPLGLLVLLAWRLLHPTMWPLWIGIPLGAFDDIMTGQPIGMAVSLWSVALMMIDRYEDRAIWHDYWADWLLVAASLLLYLVGALILTNMGGSHTPLWLVLPQLLWSLLFYPLTLRSVAALDRWRLRQ